MSIESMLKFATAAPVKCGNNMTLVNRGELFRVNLSGKRMLEQAADDSCAVDCQNGCNPDKVREHLKPYIEAARTH